MTARPVCAEVDGLLSVIITLRIVPIIRCPPNEAGCGEPSEAKQVTEL